METWELIKWKDSTTCLKVSIFINKVDIYPQYCMDIASHSDNQKAHDTNLILNWNQWEEKHAFSRAFTQMYSM